MIALFAIVLLSFLSCEKLDKKSPTGIDVTTANQAVMKSSLPAYLSSSPDIFVTTTSDVADFGGAQQVSDLPGPDGVVSLREAIDAANNTADPNVIGFKIPKTDPGFDGKVFTIQPLTPLPSLWGGETTINGATQASFTGNTNKSGPEIVIDGGLFGPQSYAIGIEISSSDNHVHGLVVHEFFDGIVFSGHEASRNKVTGCYVGTDHTGLQAMPNRENGIRFYSSIHKSNRIGGPTAGERNVISGNRYSGIFLRHGPIDFLIEGNYIGTDALGRASISNGIGIDMQNDKDMIIRRNLISGNQYVGVRIYESDNLTLEGNTLGPDITGNILPGNLQQGIGVVGETGHEPITNLRIGGLGFGSSNLISGNPQGGIVISTKLTDCLITRNIITRNNMSGIHVYCNGDENTVRISENVLAQNDVGISVLGNGTGYLISRNKIERNNQLGIELAPEHCCTEGVTPNDPGDADTGPNNFMNFPELTSAKNHSGRLLVQGTIDTPNPKTVTIEFFANPVPNPGGDPTGHGEGAIYLGSDRPNPQGKFMATLPAVAPGTLITATATDAAGNTSEFAANIVAEAPGN
jgi:parallel beta-helix repeat protein